MKDASGWSKDKLKNFLVGLEFEDPSIGSTYFQLKIQVVYVCVCVCVCN